LHIIEPSGVEIVMFLSIAITACGLICSTFFLTVIDSDVGVIVNDLVLGNHLKEFLQYGNLTKYLQTACLILETTADGR